jgi:hypothetical protein
MNAITLDTIIEPFPPSASTSTPPLNVDETVGWKSQAERLALSAKRRVRKPQQ